MIVLYCLLTASRREKSYAKKKVSKGVLLFTASLIFIFFLGPAFAEKTGTFTGTWTANGAKEFISFGEEREVALSKLSGYINLHNNLDQQKDFWAQCIGLEDTGTTSSFRCVWRSLKNEEVYVVLDAKKQQEGATVSGVIVGGTGNLAGITGLLKFKWSVLLFDRQGDKASVGRYAESLNGRYNLP